MIMGSMPTRMTMDMRSTITSMSMKDIITITTGGIWKISPGFWKPES